MISKKWKLIIISMLAVLMLSGCEKYVQSEHGTIAVSGYEEAKVAYDVAEKIYSASISEDKKSNLKELFSQYAIENDSDLDNQIQEFESILNSFKSYEGIVTTEINNDYGSHEDTFNIYLNFYDKSDKVLKVGICYYYKSDKDKSKIGIYSINCLQDSYLESGYLFKETISKPGIYFWDR